MKPDIIFISYNETNADKNWVELKSRFPRAKRVHGVKGIAEAHKKASERSETDFFFVVDGDNRIKEKFHFSVDGLHLQKDTLYVWRCYNPVNKLTYGYGAVKLYNKHLIQKRHEGYLDLATTVTEKYHIVHEVASETHFFNTPEEAWRGAFRECSKLSSQSIKRQISKETQERLDQWDQVDRAVPNAQWCYKGAQQGRIFGETLKDNPERYQVLNDFDWLRQEFLKQC